MSSNDEERLVVLLEARIRDLERNMAKASGVTAKTYREMSLGSKRATTNMEQDMVRSTTRMNQALATVMPKIGMFGKAAIGGLIGGAIAGGIAGTVMRVREIADAVAEVGDQARMAGLSTKVFQEWKFVAEQARIPIDAITDGMKELQLRADEFAVTGKGSAAEAFQRLGLTQQEVKEKLKDPSELMLLLIERTRQLGDTAAGIRIFDELFGGTGGERMVALIEQGEAGIRAQIKAANDLGIVVDEDLIKKAAEIDRQFNIIASTVGTNLKGAIVSAVDSLAEFIDGFREFQNQRSKTLQNRQTAIMGEKQDTAAEMRAVQTDVDGLGGSGATGALKGALKVLQERMDTLNREEDEIIAVLSERNKPMERNASRTWEPTDTSGSGKGGSGGRRSGAAAAAERERKAVQDLIAELEEELRLVNQSDEAKRAALASRQAGAAATDAERQQVIALTEAIHQEEEARRRAEEQTLLYRDMTRAALDDVFSGIDANKSAFEILADVAVNSLKRIADTLIDDVLDSLFKVNNAAGGSSGGFLGSLFGSIFGGGAKADPWAGMRVPGFAAGTSFAPGGAAIVGERGPELLKLPRGSQVVPNHQVRNRDGGGGSQSSVHVTSEVKVSVDENGSLKAYVVKTSQQQTVGIMKEWLRSPNFTDSIAGAVKDAQDRRLLR